MAAQEQTIAAEYLVPVRNPKNSNRQIFFLKEGNAVPEKCGSVTDTGLEVNKAFYARTIPIYILTKLLSYNYKEILSGHVRTGANSNMLLLAYRELLLSSHSKCN